MALLVLVMHFNPWLKRHLPRWRPLETLGQAALPVFCAHLVVALLALALFGASHAGRPWSVDLLILFVGFYTLWVVARISLAHDHRLAQRRARKAGRPRPLSSSDAGR
jgi:hypothetical protein